MTTSKRTRAASARLYLHNIPVLPKSKSVKTLLSTSAYFDTIKLINWARGAQEEASVKMIGEL